MIDVPIYQSAGNYFNLKWLMDNSIRIIKIYLVIRMFVYSDGTSILCYANNYILSLQVYLLDVLMTTYTILIVNGSI